MLLDDLSKHPILRSSGGEEQSSSDGGEIGMDEHRSKSQTPSEPSTSGRGHEREMAQNDFFLKEAKQEPSSSFEGIDEDWWSQLKLPEALSSSLSSSSTSLTPAPGPSSISLRDMCPTKMPHRIIRKSRFDDKDAHVCQLCLTKLRAPRGGRWNMQMHVISRHSNSKLYGCSECGYEDYRKAHIKRHSIATHGNENEPKLLVDDEKRAKWDQIMAACFPELAHRTGFLNEFKMGD